LETIIVVASSVILLTTITHLEDGKRKPVAEGDMMLMMTTKQTRLANSPPLGIIIIHWFTNTCK